MAPGISKAGLLGVALGAGSLLLADFVEVRPNRLAPGEGWSLFEALSLPVWVLLILGWAYLGAASCTVRPVVRRLGMGMVLVLGLAELWAVGHAAQTILADAPAFARVSLGPGFWVSLLGLFVAFTNLAGNGAASSRLSKALLLIFVLGCALLMALGALGQLSLMMELANRSQRFLAELRDHLFITFASVGSSALLGIPLGVAVYRRAGLRRQVFFLVNIVQTIPSLAMFGLLITPLALLSQKYPLLRDLGVRGIGWAPAVIALALYALLPIVRNTFTGFAAVDRAMVEAGQGMGMSRLQVFRRVELPVALPIVLNGLRIACVQNIGNTAVAALIGAGGFGVFIFQGLGQSAIDLVLLGAIPTILIAVLADSLLQTSIHLLTPRGLR